ncbi:hypothetical protein HMPREF9685_05642 [Klebsiella oxytoca 09-7231]|nr:hypothetical protein HMPREF9685_05642 [Klebsiella oxytoca 09-7231]
MLTKNKSNGLITLCFNSTTLWIKTFYLKTFNLSIHFEKGLL